MGDTNSCPKCGGAVDKGDPFCKHCGADLSHTRIFEKADGFETTTASSSPEAQKSEPSSPPYERKFSTLQRFYKLIVAPQSAMEDVALAPDYGGPIAIIIMEIVIGSIALGTIIQKFQFVGPAANVSTIWSIISGILTLAMIFAAVLFFVYWIVKSLLVKTFCNSGSGWTFATAASVTGYAYLADLIFGIVGAIVAWFIIPTLVIDVSNSAAATQAMAQYSALLTQRVLYALPLTFVGLLWKSYLGGIGAHFGTERNCSRVTGIAVFFVLGLIGFLISQVVRLGV